MKNYLFALLCCGLFLASCSDELTVTDQPSTPKTEEFVTVSDEGFLSFPTAQALESFFEQIQNGKLPTISPTTRGGGRFESVAMLDKRIALSRHSRAIATPSAGELDDLEEMTQEEYNLMKAENLLFDNLMSHAMDTTLRICVEGELYKITENGTFSVKLEKADKLDLAIKEFNPSLKETTNAGETVQLNQDVKFTNSFKTINENILEIEPETAQPRTSSPISANEFHKDYGVKSYQWKNDGIIQQFLDFIRGKDVSKTNNFSDKLRVQVNVFDVNYLFYKSAGVKVRMQKKKKLGFIPYWVNIEADKLAIGFNEMECVLTYENPNNMSSITPTASAQWKKFTGTLNGIAGSYLYGAYKDLKFIKDWTDVIFGWMPELKIGDKNYTDQVINKIYMTPADLIYSHTKKLINKTVYTPVEQKIKPKDPMLAYLIWGSSATQFDKEHPYIMGVKEYNNCKSKSVIFDRSFGVSFYGGIPVPYTPSDFDIKNIDVFGAAYYNNKWLGVRFCRNQ